MHSIRLDGYIRVSRVGGRHGDSFISPDAQRDQIEAFAKVMGAEVVQWHTDLDESGGKMDRPGLNAALARIDAGQTGGLIVAKIDRFARAAEAGAVVRQITDRGAVFASAAERLDPTTAIGKAMLGIMLVFAEMELDRIRDGWADSQERAVARGVHISSVPPTGYRWRSEDDKRLVVVPELAPVVAEMFRLRADGGSWEQLADHLNAHGVATPYNSPRWTGGSVQGIIENRAYLGESRGGVGFVNPDAHEAIIDVETWKAAQRAKGVAPTRRAEPHLLTGMVRCAGCRYTLKADTQKTRDGGKMRIYRCRGKQSGGVCDARAGVTAKLLDEYVVDAFFARFGEITATGRATNAELDAAETALTQAEVALVAYRDDDRILATLGNDRFVAGLQARVRAVEDAAAAVDELRGLKRLDGVPDVAVLRDVWQELPVAERRHLLRSVLDVVILRKARPRTQPVADRALILFGGEAPNDLPGRGRNAREGVSVIRPFPWPAGHPGAGRPDPA
ncbi:recombinase family protein [Baekduia soli]|uniref:Recombinase family protein n=1 Tax=Baekduia soli TaxID=496014 RepID=A0A5B8UAL1_9ACTN|nr:recombinase family protein [Baekduia soli]QEC49651.1 recombinase family protein [Baekduia soli]